MSDSDRLSQIESDLRLLKAEYKQFRQFLDSQKVSENQEPKRKPGRPRNEDKDKAANSGD